MSEPQQPTSRREARETPSNPLAGLTPSGGARTPRGPGGPQGPSGPVDPGDGPSGGKLSRRRLGLIIGGGALAFVLLGTGAVFAGRAVGSNTASATTPLPASSAAGRVVPGDQVQPTAIPTCSIDSLAGKSSLMTFSGSVVQASNGKVLYANNDTDAAQPGGVLKVLTGAAAISALGPTTRITTKVVDDPQVPGTIVLVGGGDPTISRSATGSVYAGAPTLAKLASKTLTAFAAAHPGGSITNVVLDASLWDPTDNWNSSVSTSLRAKGKLSETTALQVDGDRANPKLAVSPRSDDPVGAAGKAFVQALGLNPDDVTVTTGEAENGAPTLASVQSQPVSTLVQQMLSLGDDTLAENLARLVSLKEKLGGGSSSIQQAETTALGKYGLDTSGLTLVDGSGESDESQVPPLFLSQFMALVSLKQNGLQYVAAGFTSSGGVSQKFGSLPTAYSVSGYLTAKDGTGEAFTFYAVGQGISASAKDVLGSLSQAVHKCGKNITNN